MRVPSLDARRNVDAERALLLDMAGAVTLLARVAHDAAVAAALRAGALDGEEALLGSDFSNAAAGRALLGLGARFRAGAAAGLAGDGARHLDMRGAALERFFQRDLEIVAQVAAAVLPPALLAAGELAEQILEDVAEGAGEVERAAAAASAALLEGGMAEAVVGGALLIVLQDVIGLVDFLELDLGGRVARVLVGMQLHRELAIGRFQLADRRALLAVQNVVIVALAHRPAGYASGLPAKAAPELSVTTSCCSRRLPRTRHRRRCRPSWPRLRARHLRRRLAGPCTSLRRASSTPGPATGSWPGCRRRRRS